MKPPDVLAPGQHIVLHNWPAREVPDSLVRAGLGVTVYGGPQPDEISIHECAGDAIVSRKTGVPPTRADVVYVYPWPGFDVEHDLPRIAQAAQELHASTLWYQSGRDSEGRPSATGCWLTEPEVAQVEAAAKSAGLAVIHNVYIGAAAGQLG
jgi:hypothetical protein